MRLVLILYSLSLSALGLIALCDALLNKRSSQWQSALSNNGLSVGYEIDIFRGPASQSLAGIGLLKLHELLVSIPSISGGENAIAMFLKEVLPRDFEVEMQHVPDLAAVSESPNKQKHQKRPRFNVFAYPCGHRQTPLLLTSHMDTVPPYIPYSLLKNGDIFGRGSVDAKACKARLIGSDQTRQSIVFVCRW